ncbi:MAG: hypothetical protein IJL52_11800, partial [Clostridia bacterium]|nr:hypothetical protein [Clostridia bacterium]
MKIDYVEEPLRQVRICLSRGTPFAPDDLPADVTGDIYQFAGLIVGDYPDEMLVQCAQKGAI